MIYSYLKEGSENAVTGEELARLTHLTRREVSLQVQLERLGGFPICSTSDAKRPGYFVARTKGDIDTFCRSQERRRRQIMQTIKAFKAMRKTLPD